MPDSNELDFDRRLIKAHDLSHPQLFSFSLRYGFGIGWHCSIQESHFSAVHFGTGNSWSEAMDEAILDLEKSKEPTNE